MSNILKFNEFADKKSELCIKTNNISEFYNLMKILEENGYNWRNGSKPTSLCFEITIIVWINNIKKTIRYSSIEYYIGLTHKPELIDMSDHDQYFPCKLKK